MGLLDRKKLLSKDNLKIEKVNLGDDDFVFVRQMTGKNRDIFEKSLFLETRDEKTGEVNVDRNLDNFRAKLAVMTVCDESGTLILDPNDYETLSENISAEKLERIIEVSQKLNRIRKEDREALTKN